MTDEPTEFAAGGPPLQVVLTDRASALTGIVTTLKGVPTDAGIVLFSEEPTLWHERFTTIRLTHSTGDGSSGSPDSGAAATWRSPSRATTRSPANSTLAYFELLARHATPVVIAEAASTSLDLKLIPLR